MGFAPTVDGKVVTQHPFKPIASRVAPDVPVIFSHTSGEATFQRRERLFELDEAGMRMELTRPQRQADSLIALYRKLYPPRRRRICTSESRATPLRRRRDEGGRAASGAGRGPAYLYYWTWESPLEGGKYRAEHTIDIPFVFDNVKASRLTNGAPDAQALADQVSETFIAFFRTGNPNTPKSKLPEWPKFDPRTGRRWCSTPRRSS